MKKFTFAVIALTILVMPSCKNTQKGESEEGEDLALESVATIDEKALEADLATLIESAKRIKPVPFVKAQKDGTIALSEKEKMVKPTYLLSPSVTNGLATLYQKYRAVGMLTADKNIAEMYEMPVTEYSEAIMKILTDINDPALINFYTMPSYDIESDREAYALFIDQEYEEGRANFFWDGIAAAMVEQIYILTRDVNKFMPMFTDELASDITFNFVSVHDGLSKMVKYYPEMESLNKILEPLYVINATSVDELKAQLLQVKSDVENARDFLLK